MRRRSGALDETLLLDIDPDLQPFVLRSGLGIATAVRLPHVEPDQMRLRLVVGTEGGTALPLTAGR